MISSRTLPIQVSEVLTMSSTYRDAKELLERCPDTEVFPLVNSLDSLVLVGAVLRSHIRRSLRKFEMAIQRLNDFLTTYYESNTSLNMYELH